MSDIEKKLENINRNVSMLSLENQEIKESNEKLENESKKTNLYSFFSSKTKETLNDVLKDFKTNFLNLNSKNVFILLLII